MGVVGLLSLGNPLSLPEPGHKLRVSNDTLEGEALASIEAVRGMAALDRKKESRLLPTFLCGISFGSALDMTLGVQAPLCYPISPCLTLLE